MSDNRPSLVATFRSAVVLLAVFTAMTLAYTLMIAAIAAVTRPATPIDLVLTPEMAAASAGPGWFHGRPSAAAGGVSGGSNLGPTNPALAKLVADRVAAVRTENPAHEGPIPVDVVTASGSGLDPHISPAAARLQVARVAAATGITEHELFALVERSIEPATFGLLGHPRVNVVRLNAAIEPLRAARSSPEAPRDR